MPIRIKQEEHGIHLKKVLYPILIMKSLKMIQHMMFGMSRIKLI